MDQPPQQSVPDEDDVGSVSPVAMSRAETAALLREFADQIEAGTCSEGNVDWGQPQSGVPTLGIELLVSAVYHLGPAGQRGARLQISRPVSVPTTTPPAAPEDDPPSTE
jgi:hypothetical protein